MQRTKKIIFGAEYLLLTIIVFAAVLFVAACDPYNIGYGRAKKAEPIELPGNPIEKAAINGLHTSYKESTMWEVQKARALQTVPVAPNAAVLRVHDPKEIYCVCVEYEARYRVPWTTADYSDWERTVRNILVMKTQADSYMAMQPMSICPAFCE